MTKASSGLFPDLAIFEMRSDGERNQSLPFDDTPATKGATMSKRVLLTLTLAVSLLGLLAVPTAATDTDPERFGTSEGADDLRGRWDVDTKLGPFQFFVNDLAPKAEAVDTFLAAGCMATVGGGTAPLALQAIDKPDGTYEVIVLSSVVPAPDPEVPPELTAPFIIRFNGVVESFGSGVSDDVVAGSWTTEGEEGSWTGIHHDRRRTRCPDTQPDGLFFEADVYGVVTSSDEATLFGGGASIVSAGMRVFTPDGRIIDGEPFTDLFFPSVDFVSEFGFIAEDAGLPIAGEPYELVLLDPLGEPILGTETSDVWFECTHGAPTDLTAVQNGSAGDVDISWHPVPTAPGLDPANEVGFYQIEMGDDEGGVYGANLIPTPYHTIPWAPFDPGAEGPPFNFGSSMSDLADGTYNIDVIAFSESAPANPGHGLECQVRDENESLTMTKTSDDLTF